MLRALLVLVGLIPAAAGILLVSTGSTVFGVTLIIIAVIWVLLISLVSTALGSIVQAALYLYAAEG